MNCIVCGKEIRHQTVRPDGTGGMNPWCGDDCRARWGRRNEFLFQLPKQASISGEEVLALAIARGTFDEDVEQLTKLSQVSKTLRPLAKEHELGDAFHKPATHLQQRGTRTELTQKVTKRKTGRKINVQMVAKNGRTFIRAVDETVDEVKTVSRQVPNIVKVDIGPDEMFEIALMAYNSAISLRQKNRPVILYRVASKGLLTPEEKNTQTLSSAVHASVGRVEVWPIEKTAAWIQGAIRARVSFVLLDDPRKDEILIGGVNKRSDAVYVRELHQITSTRYEIDVATPEETPSGMRGTKVFILRPPARDIGPLPLIPKISSDIWSHTWDSSKSNLTLNDSGALIRDHIRKLFVEKGAESQLDVPRY